MTKKRIPSEHLRRKVLLLCEDANALADDIRHLAHTARNEHQAWLLAARASKIAVTAKSPDLWGWLFRHDHSSNVVLSKAS